MKPMLLALAAGALIAAQPIPVPTPPDAEAPVTDTAATDREGYRIVRGKEVAPDSARWQIQIFTTVPIPDAELAADKAMPAADPAKKFYAQMQPWERDHVCGGVLIAEGWALSAAHCFVDSRERLKPLASRRVRLGNVYLPAATEMAIERIVVHGDYRRRGDKKHDIALLKLVPDARTDPAIAAFARPVRMLAANQRPLTVGDALKVTGWGMTGERKAGAQRDIDGAPLRGSAKLLEAEQKLVDEADCRAIPSYRPTLGSGVLCVAAGNDANQDACQGDSGGPLTRQRVLVGLVSTGFGCGLKNVPALYTRVDSYAGWINSVMRLSPPGTVSRCRPAVRSGRPVLACRS